MEADESEDVSWQAGDPGEPLAYALVWDQAQKQR